MKQSTILFQISSLNLVKKIDWSVHATTGYVIRDPGCPDELMYLTKPQYLRLTSIAISNETTLSVLAVPNDTLATAAARASVSEDKTSETPPLIMENLNSRKFRLINRLLGWRIQDSMVEIKRNFYQLIPSFYRNIVSWLGSTPTASHMTDAWAYSRYFALLHRTRGINYVISRLKVELFALNSFIAGTPLKSTNDLGLRIRLSKGLPTSWPLNWRVRVRRGDIYFIRVLATLLQSYKALKGLYKDPDLSTIQAAPYAGFPTSEPYDKLPLFVSFMGYEREKLPVITNPAYDDTLDKKQVPSLKILTTAGPNNKMSILGSVRDAYAFWWKRFDRVPNSFKLYGDDVNFWSFFERFNPFIFETLHKIIKYSKVHYPQSIAALEADPRLYPPKDRPRNILGKLSLKYEAAGKVRVFAIVDYWTQMALLPLHNLIFKILRGNIADATFDQNSAVKRFSEGFNRTVYSFDLKSATDLIPRQLYSVVLEPILGKVGCAAWLSLLTDRDYYLGNVKYRYTRGQPMGALSSWASLALVHHFLVFLAATRAYGPYVLFKEYLVLGDDIVIADSKVAEAYLEVCKDYGVTVGLPKSFQSKEGFFQFASRNMIYDTDISPISIKEAFAANTLASRVEFVSRLVSRGFVELKPMKLLRASMSYIAFKRISRELTRGTVTTPVQRHLLTLLSTVYLRFLEDSELDRAYFKTMLAIINGNYSLIVRPELLDTGVGDTEIFIFMQTYFTMFFNLIERTVDDKYARVHDPRAFKNLREDIPELFMVKELGNRSVIRDLFAVRSISDRLQTLRSDFAHHTSSSYLIWREHAIMRPIPIRYWRELLDLWGELTQVMNIVTFDDLLKSKLENLATSYTCKISKDQRMMFLASHMIEFSINRGDRSRRL
jgi:hypothetical protein